jgi:cell division protein FtsB
MGVLMRSAANFIENMHGYFPKTREQRRLWLIAAICAVLALWVILGGSRGFISLARLQQEKWHLEDEIRGLVRQNQNLEKEAGVLERQTVFYERKAREELMLAKPGEIIYRFKDGGRP